MTINNLSISKNEPAAGAAASANTRDEDLNPLTNKDRALIYMKCTHKALKRINLDKHKGFKALLDFGFNLITNEIIHRFKITKLYLSTSFDLRYIQNEGLRG